MKKSLSLFMGITLWTTLASAQYVSEESYIVYQEPYVARSYGNANWSYVTAPRNYPQAGYTNAYAQAKYGQNYYDSPVFNKVNKRFYITARAGMGKTFNWDEEKLSGKTKDPSGTVLSLSLGGYLTSNVRMDAEFAYHMKGDLYEEKGVYADGKLEYSQCDFGLNGYYDFNKGSNFRPFIGLGVWGVSTKVHAKAINEYHDTYDARNTQTQFAISGALGAAFHITDTFALEAMGRARYIFDEDIYNLEGLVGTRFSF